MLPQEKVTSSSSFPTVRMRRNRRFDWMRRLLQETKLSVNDLIQPVFVCDETAERDIPSLPGVGRYCGQELVDYVGRLAELKVPAVALFPYYGVSDRQDNVESMLGPDNMVCQAIRSLKQHAPDVGIITDVALDCYTTHGQDGLVSDGQILNDETNTMIARYAVTQAESGADVIAPSEMMDGRVGVIRQALDVAGFQDVAIMSYAAKYASAFYGPFRDAVGSKSCLGQADKKTYQMDPANIEEALREVALDIQEGADTVMVKPGLPYLDVVRAVKEAFQVPTFVYHVSGEYAMLKAAAERGWLDEEACLMEALLGFKRAGASGILTYGALQAAEILRKG